MAINRETVVQPKSRQLTANTPVKLPAISRDVSCQDLCADTKNQICAPVTGIDVNATTTIAEYLKLRYGADTACSVTKSVTSSSTFADRKVETKNTICAGTEAAPKYLVQDGATYRLDQLVVEHVAGSVKKQQRSLCAEVRPPNVHR